MKKDYCIVTVLSKMYPGKTFTCFDNDTDRVLSGGKKFKVKSIKALDEAFKSIPKPTYKPSLESRVTELELALKAMHKHKVCESCFESLPEEAFKQDGRFEGDRRDVCMECEGEGEKL